MSSTITAPRQPAITRAQTPREVRVTPLGCDDARMQTRAAVLMEQPGKWEVIDAEVDDPKDHEVLVRVAAAGLCHSDDHVAKGDGKVAHLPYCGGHEAAGVVEAIGPGVSSVKVGDH